MLYQTKVIDDIEYVLVPIEDYELHEAADHQILHDLDKFIMRCGLPSYLDDVGHDCNKE